jgi:TonB family protein
LTGLSGEERKVRILFPAFFEAVGVTYETGLIFFLSVSLHALALTSPVSFAKPNQLDLIQVSILPAEYQSTAAGDGAQSSGSSHGLAAAKSSVRQSGLTEKSVSRIRNIEPAAQQTAMPLAPDRPKIESSTPIFASSQPSENQSQASIENFYGAGAMGRAAEGDAAGENGRWRRRKRIGSTGHRRWRRKEWRQYGANLTQPRYRETPKPNYPESARRKGREGTVLLRVLVNEEGRAKAIEINKSSGDDALDRAAREAVQGWRFIPARHGEKVVESWIRIPVDFRLADSNSR